MSTLSVGPGDTLLIVPCYNEALRLQLSEFHKALGEQPSLHFLFVNDGSQDQTEAILNRFVTTEPRRAALLSLPKNQGKAEAIRQGMLYALKLSREGSYLGYWDADLATPLDELPRFLEVFKAKPSLWLVMGARVNLLGRSIKRQAKRHYLGRVFATLASFVLNLPVYDTQCGAKLFRTHAELGALFASPFVSGWIFDVELLARIGSFLSARGQASASYIYEIPLLRWEDIKGSKIKGRDFFKAGLSLFRIARLYP